jgi:16S rRNA (guanine966-N2)-methyltransferase
VSLKILGGKACGRKLAVTAKPTIRPTQVLLKRRIFDSFQDLSHVIFIDLCAGSGAVGLEAWSRGAHFVHLIESNPKVFQVLKRNADAVGGNDALLGPAPTIICHRDDARSWLKRFAFEYQQWGEEQKAQTILFLDPPYQLSAVYQDIINKQLVKGRWFQGTIWLESDEQKGLPMTTWQQIEELDEVRYFQQGSSYLWVGRLAP